VENSNDGTKNLLSKLHATLRIDSAAKHRGAKSAVLSDANLGSTLWPIHAGMETYYRALTGKPFVVDKSRGWGVHFDLLTQNFEEEPKIIGMVRNLRQILASMKKKFRENPDKYRQLKTTPT
jgi:hypothetical protein